MKLAYLNAASRNLETATQLLAQVAAVAYHDDDDRREGVEARVEALAGLLTRRLRRARALARRA